MNKVICRIFIVLCLSLLFQAFPDGEGVVSYAGEPPKDPILRIETGMHTARIERIGLDEENRYLITGSPDKTVRGVGTRHGKADQDDKAPHWGRK